MSKDEIRASEIYVLNEIDWAIVYVYPEIMEALPYIKDWDKQRLLSITDFTGKTVLDIGAGTNRLTFAAVPLTKYVYASEPADRLREFIREKQKRLGIDNVYVIDGTVESIPFPDNSFDIIMSGHVSGNHFDSEDREMVRVTKIGGLLIDCPGENDRKNTKGPSSDMLRLGYVYDHYTSKTGGDVFRYWKQKSA